jgi:DNA-directed RNA polymerase subunit E'
MYNIYTIKDTFKLLPEYFDKDIQDVAAEVLQKKYEGSIDKDLGVIVAVFDVKNVSDGLIYPGDPATHHEAEFSALTFMPKVDEIILGEVTELAEFGAFVRIGPMDGLVHVSQITSDFLSFDRKVPAFVSKKTGKNLKKGDIVYAKISTVSMKTSIKDSKIALTMKPEGLGKIEWISTKSSSSSAQRGATPAKKEAKQEKPK